MDVFTFSNIMAAIQMNGLGESFLLPMILNMSITGSLVILCVLLVRLALKRAPKIFSYALWGVVLFRLLCPVSIATDFSLLGLFDTPTMENTVHTTAIEYVPFDVVHTRDLEVHLPVAPIINEAVNDVLPQEHAALGADPLEGEMAIASFVWLLGVAAMAVYSVVSYLQLRCRLLTVSPLRENIYLADEITSPFVMGLVRPKIYLPSDMEEREQAYIIRHEQHHIRRGDHIIKALAFMALSIHWFNPLVWVAFIYSNKDMEMSCDEAVVKKMGDGILADYTASLLSLATGKHIIAGMPLAFGEGDTKGRIRNLANWRKPAFWVVLIAVVACIPLAVGLLTNPYDPHAVKDELQDNTCEAISIQVINMPSYEEAGAIEVTDAEIIDRLVAKLQDATYRKSLRKIREAPDNLFADIALISDEKSFMRILMLSSVSTGNEFEIYVIAEDGTQYVMSDPLSISGSILSLIESNGTGAEEHQNIDTSVIWTYSPMMSATWHAAFHFNFGLVNYSHIEASCDNGTLWNLRAQGQPRDKTMRFEQGEPLCWMPGVGDSLTDTTESAKVTFTVYDGGEIVANGVLDIKRTGTDNGQSFYEACLTDTQILALQQESGSLEASVVIAGNGAVVAYHNTSMPEFLNDIGKTLSELKNEHPEGEFVASLDGFPDSAAACFGEPGAEYAYFFFGGQSGDFEKAMDECEEQIKCAGFITTANILFPDIEDDMSFEDFFSLIGVDDYEYLLGEEVITGEGWLRFTYNGMEVMVNTNEVTAGGGWYFTGAEIVKRNAPVSIVDPEILNTNQDLADPVMFD